MWLVEFYAPCVAPLHPPSSPRPLPAALTAVLPVPMGARPGLRRWCGHCKNLAPHWKSAARKLDGKVKLGAVDATAHQGLASRFGIRGFPTIKVRHSAPVPGPRTRPRPYSPPAARAPALPAGKGQVRRERGGLPGWAHHHGHCGLCPGQVGRAGPAPAGGAAGRAGAGGQGVRRQDHLRHRLPARHPGQVGRPACRPTLAAHLTPPSLTPRHQRQGGAQQVHRHAQGGGQAEAARPVRLPLGRGRRAERDGEGAGPLFRLPRRRRSASPPQRCRRRRHPPPSSPLAPRAQIAKSKGRASIHRGTFSDKGISTFLTGLMTGRVVSQPFDMPPVVKTEPWDGEDATPPEEEFDLADIMAEEL